MRKVFVLILFLLFSSVPALAEDDVVLAKIGDRKITMSDFNRIISYYDAEKQKFLEQNPQYKATILQRIVQVMVISKIAKDKGFDQRSDIKEQIELLSNDFLASEYLKKEVISKINVSEDDMKLYYKIHQDDFKIPEMVKARHILIKVDSSASDEDKKKARTKAEEILKKIKAGENFEKLASEVSDDKVTKTKGGDLGFVQKGKMVPEFEKVLFSLKAGEVSDVTESKFGYHIIKVDEKKDASLEPYDKVKDNIRDKIIADLRNSKTSEFIKKAMKDAGVEIHPELLKGHKK